MAPVPDGATQPAKRDAAAAAKAKSEERKAHLEAFRAAQAAKKAAAKAALETSSPPTRPSKSRVSESSKSQQKDPNIDPAAKKAASLSPDRKQRSAQPPQPGSSNSRPPSAPTSKLRGAVRTGKTKAADPLPDLKFSPFVEAQQAFGCEVSRSVESRRASQAGEPPAPASLGPGFADDGDPHHGIRWQIQMERFRLQQWKILNARLEAARAAQRSQAEAQVTIAAGAIASLKQQVAEEKVRQGKRANFELAADALAAQMPRLELYDTLKEDHQTSIEKITAAITASLQQMPLVNGAICGTAAVADAEEMRQALLEVQNVLSQVEPRAEPLMAKSSAQEAKENEGMQAIAKAAQALATADGELRAFLKKNAGLVGTLEKELLHSESLAIQLLQMQGGK